MIQTGVNYFRNIFPNDQNEAQSNYKILEKIVNACKAYKVPQDLQNESQKNKLFVILLGVTGIGKTTIFNFLRGAKMKLIKAISNLAHLEVEGDIENQQYKIGNNQQSQTMEPVHFSLKHNGQEMILIDTPGYGATDQQNYTKQEQQWLDSLKMRKYFKKCRKCILLPIMEEKFYDRSLQLDLEDFLDYIQRLTGISNRSYKLLQFLPSIHQEIYVIIINKSGLENDEKEEYIKILRDQLEQVQVEQQQQSQEEIKKRENSLKYFIEILSNKNNKGEIEFHIIQQVTKKQNVYNSQEKRGEILNFIQSLEPQEMSSQPFFQNQKLLNQYLKNIKDDLYKMEVEKLFQNLESVTDEIKKKYQNIIVSEFFLMKCGVNITNFFKNQENKKQVLCQKTVRENEEHMIIYQIMNCLLQCYEELYFYKPNINQQGVIIEENKDQKQLKQRIKKFPTTKLSTLINLINNYRKRNDNQLNDFQKYYQIIRKFAIPKQIIREEDLLNYKKEMLLTKQIRNEFKKQIEKIIQFRDKMNNLLFRQEFQIEFEINNYLNSNWECESNVINLLYLLAEVYDRALNICRTLQTSLEKFIQNDKVISRYWDDNDSSQHQAIIGFMEFLSSWQKEKNKLICNIFDVPSDSLIDGTKLETLLNNRKEKIQNLRSRLKQIQEDKEKYQLNEETIFTLTHLISSSFLENQVQDLVKFLLDLKLYDHNDEDLFVVLRFIRDNCFLGAIQYINFFRSKGEYSDKYYQPALDKINNVIMRIQEDRKKIQAFVEYKSIEIQKCVEIDSGCNLI